MAKSLMLRRIGFIGSQLRQFLNHKSDNKASFSHGPEV